MLGRVLRRRRAEDLSAPSARDAAIAGISEVTVTAVRQRRTQLSLLLLVVLMALVIVTALAPLGPGGTSAVDPAVLKAGLVLLSATFAAYALEKERALRRLETALRAGYDMAAAVQRESRRLADLVEAATEVAASLDVDRVATLTLDAGLRLTGAPEGALFLDRGDLVAHAHRVESQDLGRLADYAREAMRTGAVTRSEDPAEGETVALPLAHDHPPSLGVLVMHGLTDTDDADLEALQIFARSAAAALAHARVFRAEQLVNRHFPGLDDARREFGWLAAES